MKAHQITDLSTEILIHSIAANLARISQWLGESPELKKSLIEGFAEQTDRFVSGLQKRNISDEFEKTLILFCKEYKKFRENQIGNKDAYFWSESMLTWANILQHRAKLA